VRDHPLSTHTLRHLPLYAYAPAMTHRHTGDWGLGCVQTGNTQPGLALPARLVFKRLDRTPVLPPGVWSRCWTFSSRHTFVFIVLTSIYQLEVAPASAQLRLQDITSKDVASNGKSIQAVNAGAIRYLPSCVQLRRTAHNIQTRGPHTPQPCSYLKCLTGNLR